MTEPRFVPLASYREYPVDEMERRAVAFHEELNQRRTVREYSNRAVPRVVIEHCLRAAGTAPSGANRQPWHFAVVEQAEIKQQIRVAAEKEEKDFYENRAPPDWLEALRPLGTDAHKPFLETAPYLIAVFAERYVTAADGARSTNYYVMESVGLATGMLIAALHHAGLAILTHTPSPMGFLNDILDRPGNERPFLLLVVGYPADDAVVPDISRKELDDFVSFL